MTPYVPCHHCQTLILRRFLVETGGRCMVCGFVVDEKEKGKR